jgi:His-Xaa-Ser system protein HxsD
MTELRFSKAVYSLDTIKRAAYRLSAELAFTFEIKDEYIVCDVHPIGAATADEVQAAINAFKNEVLDQDLRKTIAEETSAVRNVILAHVFSNTGLQHSE